MYIHIYIYEQIDIYTHMYVCAHMHEYIYTHINIYIYRKNPFPKHDTHQSNDRIYNANAKFGDYAYKKCSS